MPASVVMALQFKKDKSPVAPAEGELTSDAGGAAGFASPETVGLPGESAPPGTAPGGPAGISKRSSLCRWFTNPVRRRFGSVKENRSKKSKMSLSAPPHEVFIEKDEEAAAEKGRHLVEKGRHLALPPTAPRPLSDLTESKLLAVVVSPDDPSCDTRSLDGMLSSCDISDALIDKRLFPAADGNDRDSSAAAAAARVGGLDSLGVDGVGGVGGVVNGCSPGALSSPSPSRTSNAPSEAASGAGNFDDRPDAGNFDAGPKEAALSSSSSVNAPVLSVETSAPSDSSAPSTLETTPLEKSDADRKGEAKEGSGGASEANGSNAEAEKQKTEEELAVLKRSYVLQELIETEKQYVNDLKSVCEDYIPRMKGDGIPDGLQGNKELIIFGNIQMIYEFHRNIFLPDLEKCSTSKSPNLFLVFCGRTGERQRRLEHIYNVYCENKPKSEAIVGEFLDTFFETLRREFNHRLQISDFLIKPVQRIMKYQLLLKDILKYSERTGEDTAQLKKVVSIMQRIPKAANEMMTVGRLQGFDNTFGKITAQGKLLILGAVQVAEMTTSHYEALTSTGSPDSPTPSPTPFVEREVFLFEQLIVFAEKLSLKKGMSQPFFLYKNQVKVNKMLFVEKPPKGIPQAPAPPPQATTPTPPSSSPTPTPTPPTMTTTTGNNEDPTNRVFVIHDKQPEADKTFVLALPSAEDKDKWTNAIKGILDVQNLFLMQLQNPTGSSKPAKTMANDEDHKSGKSHSLFSHRFGIGRKS